jgi:hypothetical protein
MPSPTPHQGLRDLVQDKGQGQEGITMEVPGVSVKLFIKFFAIPKGEDNIRMVYNVTANKLNEAVWVPMFWLPTIDTLV